MARLPKTKPPQRKKAPRPSKRARPRAEAPPSDVPPGARVIRRYNNRRLYDARDSRCVTVQEIAEMLRRNEDVRILDADTGEDISRRIYTQIILEESNQSQLDILPVPLLRMLITLRHKPLAGWLGQYLEAGTRWLDAQMSQGAAGAASRTSGAAVDFDLFPWMKWFDPEKSGSPMPPPPSAQPSPQPSDAADDPELREELDNIEAQLRKLRTRVRRR